MAEQSTYSISDLASYSGVKAHTIRIWEKRYNLLCPSRSCTNIRAYCNNDLRKLININSLINAGWKISKIVELSDAELEAEVKQLMSGKDSNCSDFLINGLMTHMLQFDEGKFTDVLIHAFESYGVKDAMLKIVYPFLKRIGVLWQTNDVSPAQEHFASAIIRRKILATMDAMPKKYTSDKVFILCLPPDEFHELPLLLSQYILLEHGIKTVYLGSSVPADVAVVAAQQAKATHLCTFFMSNSPMGMLKEYLVNLQSQLPDIKILFSGCPEMCKKPIVPGNVIHLGGIAEFEEIVKGLE